jgi:hypothetical protein
MCAFIAEKFVKPSLYLCVFVFLGGVLQAAPKKIFDSKYSSVLPQAGIPIMNKAPVIDGNIDAKEWQGALCLTGFNMPRVVYVLPKQMQGRMYLGYDEQNFYLGLVQPKLAKDLKDIKIPEKRKNDPCLGYPHWWLKFHTPKNGGYEFILTPLDNLRDRNDANSYTMEKGLDWNSQAEMKSSIKQDCWITELKIPFASMKYKNGPKLNEVWKVHFMYSDRGGCSNQAEWNGAMDFHNRECGEIIFSGKVPAFQFLDTGRLERLEFAPRFQISNPTDKEQEIDFNVSIQSGTQVIIDRSKKIALKPGEAKQIDFGPDKIVLPAGQTGRMEIDINTPQDHLYSSWLQFKKLSFSQYTRLSAFNLNYPELKDDWLLGCANYPYYKSLKVMVNTRYPHLPEDVKKATSCKVKLKNIANSKIIKTGTVPVNLLNGKGDILWKNIDLPEGKYQITGQLFNNDKAVGKVMTHDFERKVYPWEHNKIGISNKVYPPFTSIKAEGLGKGTLSFSPWGRKYAIGDNAMPGEITATKETLVPGKIINEGFKLELTTDGKTSLLAGKTKVVKAEPGLVELESFTEKNGIDFKIKSFMQYDGWYQTTIKIIPQGEKDVDKLELIIPFGKYADTYYGYRRNWFYGGLSKKQGVIWQNLAKKRNKFENKFTPCMAVGDGDVCLWWYADSDQEWQLDYTKPSQMITRDENGINLKCLFINNTVKLKKPFEITFAVLANPAKPYPANKRKVEWNLENERTRWHDTSGYGFWGNGVDSITCGTEAGYKKTRDTIDRWTGRKKTDAPKPFPPIILYNSGQAIGRCMPEFDTFSGEWCDETPKEANPEFKDSDRAARITWIHPNMGHQIDWRSRPEKLVPGWGDLTWSNVDCRIWHYRDNMEKLDINGYWFDNNPIHEGRIIGTGRAYLTKDGELRPNYNIFERHSLYRRLFVMYREAGKQTWNLISYSPDFSFAQWIWMVEMDAYVNKGETMFDTLRRQRFYDIISRIIAQENTKLDPIARHRAITRMRSVMGATASNVHNGDIKASRSVIGLALLHDFGISGGVDDAELHKIKLILNNFGFGNSKIKYLPYWRNQRYVKSSNKEVAVTLYRNLETNQVLGIIANPSSKKVDFKLSMNTLGLKNPVLENPESHNNFKCSKEGDWLTADISIEDCGVLLFLLRDKGIQDDNYKITGTLDREYWTDVKGGKVEDLKKSSTFPDSPAGQDKLTSFESNNWSDKKKTRNWGVDFGERIRGYLLPPETGEYVFTMRSDDGGELFLSCDDNPKNAKLILEEPACGTQQSKPIKLQKGKVYYIEALHKQGAGGCGFSVSWKTPSDRSRGQSKPIAGKYLSSFKDGKPVKINK